MHLGKRILPLLKTVDEKFAITALIMMKRFMHSRFIVTACLCLFLIVLSSTADAKRPVVVKIGIGEARVTFIKGVATVTSAGETRIRVLETGSVIREGDHVKTAVRTLLELILPDGSFLRFAENTDFTVRQIQCSKKERKRIVRLRVAVGKTWASIKQIVYGLRPRVKLSASNAVCGVRGTVFRMNVDADQSILVRTYDGEVQVSQGEGPVERPHVIGPPKRIPGPKPVPGPHKVTMEEWTFIVRSMQQIRIGSDGVAEKPEAFTEQEDKNDWVDWNRERDEMMKDTEVSLDE